MRLSGAGDALERLGLRGWSAQCRVKFEDERFWLEPLPDGPLTLNGLPLDRPAPIQSGDVVGCFAAAYRLTVEGHAPLASAVTEAEVFAHEVRLGLLSVEDAGHVRWRWRWEARHLTDFAQTALARSAASLEVVVCRGEGATVEADQVLELASALGPLSSKTTFVVPAALDGLPAAVGVRVSEPVEVSFDGQLLPLTHPVWLAAGPQGLQLEHTFSPAPFLFTLGQGAFLSCEQGWAGLDWIGRPEAPVVIAPTPRFQLPLLAGDEWRLGSGQVTHLLTVRAASAEPPAPRPPPNALPFVFEGDAYRSVTFMLEAEDLVFTQGADGLFSGPGPALFGVSGPGKLQWLRSEGRAFTFYEDSPLPAPSLVLPSPSGFLRGRTPFPEGPLTHDRLEVFIDHLLDQQDGAAVALRRLVRGEPGERPEWFARLFVSPHHRHKLRKWLEQERDTLSLFAPELQLNQSEFAGPVLHAIATEPLFGYVREVRLDVDDTRWLDFMHFVCAIPNVRVIGCKHGEEIARFEPGAGVQLDAPTARFYERHL